MSLGNAWQLKLAKSLKDRLACENLSTLLVARGDSRALCYCAINKKGLVLVRLSLLFFGADERNRTVDPHITNVLLYRLSYTGDWFHYKSFLGFLTELALSNAAAATAHWL